MDFFFGHIKRFLKLCDGSQRCKCLKMLYWMTRRHSNQTDWICIRPRHQNAKFIFMALFGLTFILICVWLLGVNDWKSVWHTVSENAFKKCMYIDERVWLCVCMCVWYALFNRYHRWAARIQLNLITGSMNLVNSFSILNEISLHRFSRSNTRSIASCATIIFLVQMSFNQSQSKYNIRSINVRLHSLALVHFNEIRHLLLCLITMLSFMILLHKWRLAFSKCMSNEFVWILIADTGRTALSDVLNYHRGKAAESAWVIFFLSSKHLIILHAVDKKCRRLTTKQGQKLKEI